jgi:hypothetical protein
MKQSRPKAGDKLLSPFAKAALKAMRQARREAERENARWGLPMIVWKKGRIVELPTRKRN